MSEQVRRFKLEGLEGVIAKVLMFPEGKYMTKVSPEPFKGEDGKEVILNPYWMKGKKVQEKVGAKQRVIVNHHFHGFKDSDCGKEFFAKVVIERKFIGERTYVSVSFYKLKDQNIDLNTEKIWKFVIRRYNKFPEVFLKGINIPGTLPEQKIFIIPEESSQKKK